MNRPILVTGVPRSGATFIARILEMCGANKGICTGMYENVHLTELCEVLANPNLIPSKLQIRSALLRGFEIMAKGSVQNQGLKEPWFFKSSSLTLTWEYWTKTYPNAQWVLVRRKTPYIINSCEKTAWMDLMKKEHIRKQIGVETEREGWLWLVHYYESQWLRMAESGIEFIEIYPDRMENLDFVQIQNMIIQLGLEWTNDVISTMYPYFVGKKKGEYDGK